MVDTGTNSILKHFGKIAAKAEKINNRLKTKRLYVMTHGSSHKVTDIGIYDSLTKKYALTDIRAYNVNEVMSEIESLVNSVSIKL